MPRWFYLLAGQASEKPFVDQSGSHYYSNISQFVRLLLNACFCLDAAHGAQEGEVDNPPEPAAKDAPKDKKGAWGQNNNLIRFVSAFNGDDRAEESVAPMYSLNKGGSANGDKFTEIFMSKEHGKSFINCIFYFRVHFRLWEDVRAEDVLDAAAFPFSRPLSLVEVADVVMNQNCPDLRETGNLPVPNEKAFNEVDATVDWIHDLFERGKGKGFEVALQNTQNRYYHTEKVQQERNNFPPKKRIDPTVFENNIKLFNQAINCDSNGLILYSENGRTYRFTNRYKDGYPLPISPPYEPGCTSAPFLGLHERPSTPYYQYCYQLVQGKSLDHFPNVDGAVKQLINGKQPNQAVKWKRIRDAGANLEKQVPEQMAYLRATLAPYKSYLKFIACDENTLMKQLKIQDVHSLAFYYNCDFRASVSGRPNDQVMNVPSLDDFAQKCKVYYTLKEENILEEWRKFATIFIITYLSLPQEHARELSALADKAVELAEEREENQAKKSQRRQTAAGTMSAKGKKAGRGISKKNSQSTQIEKDHSVFDETSEGTSDEDSRSGSYAGSKRKSAHVSDPAKNMMKKKKQSGAKPGQDHQRSRKRSQEDHPKSSRKKPTLWSQVQVEQTVIAQSSGLREQLLQQILSGRNATQGASLSTATPNKSSRTPSSWRSPHQQLKEAKVPVLPKQEQDLVASSHRLLESKAQLAHHCIHTHKPAGAKLKSEDMEQLLELNLVHVKKNEQNMEMFLSTINKQLAQSISERGGENPEELVALLNKIPLYRIFKLLSQDKDTIARLADTIIEQEVDDGQSDDGLSTIREEEEDEEDEEDNNGEEDKEEDGGYSQDKHGKHERKKDGDRGSNDGPGNSSASGSKDTASDSTTNKGRQQANSDSVSAMDQSEEQKTPSQPPRKPHPSNQGHEKQQDSGGPKQKTPGSEGSKKVVMTIDSSPSSDDEDCHAQQDTTDNGSNYFHDDNDDSGQYFGGDSNDGAQTDLGPSPPPAGKKAHNSCIMRETDTSEDGNPSLVLETGTAPLEQWNTFTKEDIIRLSPPFPGFDTIVQQYFDKVMDPNFDPGDTYKYFRKKGGRVKMVVAYLMTKFHDLDPKDKKNAFGKESFLQDTKSFHIPLVHPKDLSDILFWSETALKRMWDPRHFVKQFGQLPFFPGEGSRLLPCPAKTLLKCFQEPNAKRRNGKDSFSGLIHDLAKFFLNWATTEGVSVLAWIAKHNHKRHCNELLKVPRADTMKRLRYEAGDDLKPPVDGHPAYKARLVLRLYIQASVGAANGDPSGVAGADLLEKMGQTVTDCEETGCNLQHILLYLIQFFSVHWLQIIAQTFPLHCTSPTNLTGWDGYRIAILGSLVKQPLTNPEDYRSNKRYQPELLGFCLMIGKLLRSKLICDLFSTNPILSQWFYDSWKNQQLFKTEGIQQHRFLDHLIQCCKVQLPDAPHASEGYSLEEVEDAFSMLSREKMTIKSYQDKISSSGSNKASKAKSAKKRSSKPKSVPKPQPEAKAKSSMVSQVSNSGSKQHMEGSLAELNSSRLPQVPRHGSKS